MRGISPTVTNTTQQGNSSIAPFSFASEIPRERMMLREVFPASSMFRGVHVLGSKWAQTPFRIAMNAGDLLSRRSVPGGSNQVKGAVGKYKSIYFSDSAHKGDGATGNSKYVYDSSVYTKFKHLSAKTRTYDDPTFGGSNNGDYVALRASKRFLL
jgi:hypothetical protein